MIHRRDALLAGAAVAATMTGCATRGPVGDAGARGFVRAGAGGFTVDGAPYRYAGANLWYAAHLGADAPYGDRARLGRELDRLKAMGVDNLRILGGSEESRLRGAISPAIRGPDRPDDPRLLAGLDWAMAEIARRDMRAVIYFTNFWEWSGGMMTMLSWENGGRFIDMNDPAQPWPAFPDFLADFYGNERAVAGYHRYVRSIVTRTNGVTGRRYADDPAIMAWQLANEPRPAGSDAVARRSLPLYMAWIRDTARLIKSLDPDHLLSTGGEGLKGCMESEACVLEANGAPGIDYLTIHIWPQNWSWVDQRDLPGTAAEGERQTADYIATHVAHARRLSQPLVIEEFGYPRDGGSNDPAATTRYRDRFYRLIFDAVRDSAASGGPIAGTNFWAWNGEGRAAHADHRFRPGDLSYLGDPPHEPQGWYGVFDNDRTTHAIIRDHAAQMQAIAATRAG